MLSPTWWGRQSEDRLGEWEDTLRAVGIGLVRECPEVEERSSGVGLARRRRANPYRKAAVHIGRRSGVTDVAAAGRGTLAEIETVRYHESAIRVSRRPVVVDVDVPVRLTRLLLLGGGGGGGTGGGSGGGTDSGSLRRRGGIGIRTTHVIDGTWRSKSSGQVMRRMT